MRGGGVDLPSKSLLVAPFVHLSTEVPNEMFNPIPKDAPEFFSDRAHYIDYELISSRRRKSVSRYFIFKIGRSDKAYWFHDKHRDNKAARLLENTVTRKVRLVIKGYLSPVKDSPVNFAVLTHFGIYHKPNRSEYQTYNPDGGDIGFYRLRTE